MSLKLKHVVTFLKITICFLLSRPFRLHEKKNATCSYYFQIFLFVPEIFKFLKYANWPSDDFIHSTRLCSNMIKSDISASLYQKCLILFSKVLLNVQYELNSSVIMATYWVPDLPHIKSFSGHLWRSILIFANSTSYA